MQGGGFLVKVGLVIGHPPVFSRKLNYMFLSVAIQIKHPEDAGEDKIFKFGLVTFLHQVLVFFNPAMGEKNFHMFKLLIGDGGNFFDVGS
jgi:hypothetical protein